MTQWLTSLLASIVPSLFVGVITAVITVRLSLRRFRSERWWEHKADIYSRIVEALHNATEYCEAMSGESLIRVEISAERKAQLIRDYRQATLELRKATGVGAYIISSEVADALARLQSRPELDWEKTPTFEFYDHEREGYKAALTEIRELAKQDLEVRPHYMHNKMKGWIRLAIVLSVFWLIGCSVIALIELSLLPAERNCVLDRPGFEVFFHSTKISAVYVRHPQLGLVAFPATMSRSEIEDALRHNLPKFYQPTNAPIEWDVKLEKPSEYYSITFDKWRFFALVIFPAVAIFIAVLVFGCGTRWIVQGFST